MNTNEQLERLQHAQDSLQTAVKCFEKRQCQGHAGLWDFGRIVNVEVDCYRDRLAPMNLKQFLIFRAQQIDKELIWCKSWKTYFKGLLLKIQGKSLAWELTKMEALKALDFKDDQKTQSSLDYLKSEDGWGVDFEKKMAKVLAQPW